MPAADITLTRAKYPVAFTSRASAQRVVMVPGRVQRNSYGEPIGDLLGHVIEFVDGRFVAETNEEIEFLRGRMNAASGADIWEIGATDAPDSKATLQALAVGSSDEVREILREELETWQRQDIVVTARKVLEARGEPVEADVEPVAPVVATEPELAPEPGSEPVAESDGGEQNDGDPGSMSWPQLKSWASKQGINTQGKKRPEIEQELAALSGEDD